MINSSPGTSCNRLNFMRSPAWYPIDSRVPSWDSTHDDADERGDDDAIKVRLSDEV